jgi:transcriptional regulator with XRE-family HTH domain
MLETKKIGNRIAEARKRISISQTELAQQLFISPQAVGKWERGESMPDITTFNRLAEILGVDLNYFSDNFQSSVTGTSTSEPLENQSAELSTGRQKKNLVWDMSRMNLVDTDFSGLKNLHEKFSSSNMLNCQFIGSEMSGLILKNNKKMKQVEFIDCKADKITYAFLKNNLANLTGITLLSE